MKNSSLARKDAKLEEKIKRFLDKSEYYLKEVINLRRGFIQNLCVISAAVASFSMPLFLLPFIDHSLLFSGIALCSFVIIAGCYSLKVELESENDNIMEMRRAILEKSYKSAENILKKYDARKGKKDYTLDIMVYPLCGGVIAILLSLFFGIVQ